jgi:hypothetical protein
VFSISEMNLAETPERCATASWVMLQRRDTAEDDALARSSRDRLKTCRASPS